jgi:oligosaccharide translocation protein RFT1
MLAGGKEKNGGACQRTGEGERWWSVEEGRGGCWCSPRPLPSPPLTVTTTALCGAMAGTSSFASSASLLVGLQLGSRLLTFALNQALLRFVSSRAFGTASIQFELLSSTILFLSREGFRNALIRAWNDHQKQDRESSAAPLRITNLSLVPTLVGIPVAVVASALYRTACSRETRTQAYFDFAVLLYSIAACVELASEPMHIK